jgi:phosphonate transport system substrate-binding protein
MDSTNLTMRLAPSLIIALLFLLSGCAGSPEVAFTPLPVNTPLTTLTPTRLPPGSPENPLVLGLVNENQSNTEALHQDAQALVNSLSQKDSLTLDFRFYPTYDDLLQALEDHQVYWTFLPPLTYLYAHQHNLADVELLSNHFGVYFYSSIFLSNVESGMVSYYDPTTGQSTASAEVALTQFARKRPCWTEPTSIAGYLLPRALLQSLEIETLPAVITQTPSGIVPRPLY